MACAALPVVTWKQTIKSFNALSLVGDNLKMPSFFIRVNLLLVDFCKPMTRKLHQIIDLINVLKDPKTGGRSAAYLISARVAECVFNMIFILSIFFYVFSSNIDSSCDYPLVRVMVTQ